MIRKALLLAGILTGSVLFAPAPALACTPIEALFGACRLDVFQPAYAPPDAGRYRPARPSYSHQRKAVRPKPRPVEEAAVSGKETPIEATPDAPTGSLAQFRKDSTLRNGDIFVTNDGFRVYRNGKFAAIAQDGGKLAQLEKASMSARMKPDRLQAVADRRK